MTELRLSSLLALLAMWPSFAWAQLPAGELRLWLKADTLNLPEDAQVTQWIDSSSHGTIFAPRTAAEPNGPLGGGPVEEFPHLETVVLNGRSFPTVKFERNGSAAGNPNVDRSGSTDRLFQVSNRSPGADPLAIADGASVTSFTVFRPAVTTGGALGVQAVWAKRGNDASLLELGMTSTGHLIHVTYDSFTGYQVANPTTANKWHIVAQTITEAGAHDSIQFLVNDTESAASPLALNPVVTNGGQIANRNDAINEDPPGALEPFGIGGHGQDCCGEGETFAGNIAEIIIYARALTPSETSQVYSYLTSKYLGPPLLLGGDYNADGIVDAGDYVVWRDNLGQFVGLPNEKPAAASEGFVDEEDYDYWVANYGATWANAAQPFNVPEPASAGLAAIACLTKAMTGRRR
ncbi:MAG: hypothetical protein DCC67_09350 [Planctomycetota bacterium]|nr:MAG: hypothetical protein DCC67_09350 [Planctomycetota bacterium]